jgi:hypothetical protein
MVEYPAMKYAGAKIVTNITSPGIWNNTTGIIIAGIVLTRDFIIVTVAAGL